MSQTRRLDEIGIWSEVKLAILRDYASAYSRILAAQSSPKLHHVYVDGFAGAGVHISKMSGEFIPGSPLNALNIQPPFREYFLVDLNRGRVAGLKELIGERTDVHLFAGDCNEVLLKDVFPRVRYNDYRRGLCVLDPYGLHLNWEVIRTAGEMQSIDMFLNFPLADMNHNVLWHNTDRVNPKEAGRMTRFWGDESWREAAYSQSQTLFGDFVPEKEPNAVVAEAFRQRLRKVAGFKRVPEPLPMRNSKGSIVYYLFFASQKGTAENIVLDIFNKYRNAGLAR